MSESIAMTGVGAVIGHGVVKSIRHSRKYKSSHLVGMDCNPDAIGFYLCDRHYVVDMVSSPGYIDSLLDICRRESVDAFLPLIEEEFIPIYDNIHRFEDIGTRVIMQPRAVIETFLDKYSTAEALRQAGIAVPDTLPFTPENREGIMRMVEKYGFPLFAKPRRSRSSKGLLRIGSIMQLNIYLELFKDENYVVQEYLSAEDEEYTCAIFKTPAMKEPYVISLKRQLLNGTTVSAEVAFDDQIVDTCTRIASKFPLEGSLNVQLRKKDGIPYVFEVNPRYSSTSFIRAMCGFNDVEMGLEYALYGRVNGAPRIEKLKVIRYFEEKCVSCA